MSNTAVPDVRVRIPAKVNLLLNVGPVRADGYHELVTVFQAVSLFDDVTVQLAERFELTVSGVDAQDVPSDERNLAWQAAELLASEFGDRAGRRPLAAHIHIDKRIPVAGGMAGGSADAAGALVACARLWEIPLTNSELHMLAAKLGSDVNFCLIGGTAIGRGRGEQLTPLTTAGTFHWVFATAEGGIPARDAYTELDRLRVDGLSPRSDGLPQSSNAGPLRGDDPAQVTAIAHALRDGQVGLARTLLHNDLEIAAVSLRPSLFDTLRVGAQMGATGLISGSGPTCAFAVDTAERARQLATYLKTSSTCVDAIVATGPVPGPLASESGTYEWQ